MTVPTEDFWAIESLRLTAFTIDPVEIGELDWWERVLGSPSDQSQVDRKRSRLAQLGALPGESRLNAQLRLLVEPLRAQWDLVPAPQEITLDWLTLGQWDQAVAPFHTLMTRWLELSPPIFRLAFGAVLLADVPAVSEGYERLGTFLPFKVDPNSSDFLLQTNKPVESVTCEGLTLNRLTKWSVMSAQLLTLPVGPGVSQTSKQAIACRLELDMNSPAERTTALASESLPSLWMELVQLGKRVADDGIRAW